MHLREVSAADRTAVFDLHERSVVELAASEYDEAVLDTWTSLPDDATDDYEDNDGQPENGHRVLAELQPPDGAGITESQRSAAETEGAAIAGFGDVRFDPAEYLSEPTDGGVRAVYVDPDFAGNGVGSHLLAHLESEARDRNLGSLGLLASVNAEGFYANHGYEVVAETTFEFGSEVEGPAVEMRKEL